MQRLHDDDLTAHLMESGVYYEHLVLPMEYEGIRFVSSIGFRDPRSEFGELLWEKRFPRSYVEQLKLTQGKRGYSSQYQQNPGHSGGNIFLKEWFEERNDSINFVKRFISWDTASTANETSAYSSCVVGDLLHDYRLLIRYVFQKKMEFPELVKTVEEIAKKYSYNLEDVVIESKSSGMSLIQTLKQSSNEMIANKLFPFNPPSGKESRGEIVSIWCENGRVLLPSHNENNEWLTPFEDQLFLYPNTKYKDMTDAFIQLLLWVESYLSQGLRERNFHLKGG